MSHSTLLQRTREFGLKAARWRLIGLQPRKTWPRGIVPASVTRCPIAKLICTNEDITSGGFFDMLKNTWLLSYMPDSRLLFKNEQFVNQLRLYLHKRANPNSAKI